MGLAAADGAPCRPQAARAPEHGAGAGPLVPENRRAVPGARAERLFTAGLLSVLDALLDKPMAAVVTELPLGDNLRDALLGHSTSKLALTLRRAIACETGQWNSLGLDEQAAAASLLDAYVDALEFAAAPWRRPSVVRSLKNGVPAIGTIVSITEFPGRYRTPAHWIVTVEFTSPPDWPNPQRVDVRLGRTDGRTSQTDCAHEVGQSVPLHYRKFVPTSAVIDEIAK